MEVTLEIKNISKIMKPKEGDIILYDGKTWYVTSKEELFKWFSDKVDELENAFANLKKDNNDFKVGISQQMSDMSNVVTQLFNEKGE